MTESKFGNRAALFDRPAVLFLPASRPGAVAKARESSADMAILDLEDAVPEDQKEAARQAAVDAVAEKWPMPVAIRVNAPGTQFHGADVSAAAKSCADMVVVPLVSDPEEVVAVERVVSRPVAAMIETARGVRACDAIAEVAAALIVGTNDLAADLRLPSGAPREGMMFSIQRVLLAARARGIAAYDGVFNKLDDMDGFEAEARQSHALGFDGKTLIHPKQIATCQEIFAPSDEDIGRAERLLASAGQSDGALNFEGEMVEAMHVAAAKRLLERAGRA